MLSALDQVLKMIFVQNLQMPPMQKQQWEIYLLLHFTTLENRGVFRALCCDVSCLYMPLDDYAKPHLCLNIMCIKEGFLTKSCLHSFYEYTLKSQID